MTWLYLLLAIGRIDSWVPCISITLVSFGLVPTLVSDSGWVSGVIVCRLMYLYALSVLAELGRVGVTILMTLMTRPLTPERQKNFWLFIVTRCTRPWVRVDWMLPYLLFVLLCLISVL